MALQKTFQLKKRQRGCHLITREIINLLGPLPQTGLLHLFIQHTSCALTINENADPSVRIDMESMLNKMIPEGQAFYTHTLEGLDDMPAHLKSSIFGASISIPISKGQLKLGTWQGIYFCEFRNNGGARTVVATILE